MAHENGLVLMCTEECDPRALEWLLKEATLEDVYKASDAGAAASTAPVCAFTPTDAFARAQGYGDSRFDAAKLWAILRKQIAHWAAAKGKVWYRYSAALSNCAAGHLIASSGYQHWPATIRATLVHGVYLEVGIVHSFATLLHQVATQRGWEANALSAYIQDPTAAFQSVADEAYLTLEEAVEAVHAVLGGCDSKVYGDCSVLQSLCAEVGLMQTAACDVLEWQPLKTAVEAAQTARAKALGVHARPGNVKRELLNVAVHTAESNVLMAAARALSDSHGLHAATYMRDSLLVKRPAHGAVDTVPSDVLRAVEAAVLAKTGFSVQLQQRVADKKMAVPAEPAKSGADAPVRSISGLLRKQGAGDKKRKRRGSAAGDPGGASVGTGGGVDDIGEPGDDSDVLAPGVTKAAYAEMKVRFEESHFYYVPANTFVEVTEDFSMRHYDLRHAKEYFDIGWAFGGEQNFRFRVSFLDLWRMDPSRKTIHRIDFKPSDDPTVFYLPLQFAYTRVKPEQLALPPPAAGAGAASMEEAGDGEAALLAHKDALWDLFLTLIKAACDDKPDLVEYLLNYFAHMLQKPLEQPGVAIILTGQKGVGKDTLLDFFRLYVIGPGLSHNYTETRQFFDKHDVDRKDKIFVKVEDSDSALCKQHAKDLRARITAREGTINPKGKDPITFPNYVRYAFTANQAIPVGINDDNDRERRFVILPVSSALKGRGDFFATCYDEERGLYTPLGGVVVAERLLQRDLTGWNVRLQPKNDYQEALYEVERTPEQRFLEDGWAAGAEYKSADLFARYQKFCGENGFPKWTETAIAFGQKLAYFVMQKKIAKRVGSKKAVFYKKLSGAGGMGEDEEEEEEKGMEAFDEGAGAGAGAFSFSTVSREL